MRGVGVEQGVATMKLFVIVFPSVLIALDMAAGICYLADGDWKRFIYWWAAATLTATVTY